MSRRILFALFLVFSLASPAATAFEFSPIIAQFDPSGPGSARTFIAHNTQQEPVALQIEVFSRSADETGAETRVPDHDNFIITPPQLVLAPGTSRSVRVQWLGEAAPEQELAFRIVVSQIPINFDQESDGNEISASVAIGYKYEVAAYVAPAKTTPKAILASAEPVTRADDQKELRLTLRSTGTRRAILNQPKITVRSASGAEVTLEGDSLPGLHMRNMLSGTQAIISVPWPDQLPFGPVDATLDTAYVVMN